MKYATKPHDIIHLNLGMLLHYLGKLKIQIFCRCERKHKHKQTAFLSPLCYSSTNFDIFGVYNSNSFHIL